MGVRTGEGQQSRAEQNSRGASSRGRYAGSSRSGGTCTPSGPTLPGCRGQRQGHRDKEAGVFGILVGESSKEQATERKLERGNHKQGRASGRDGVTSISQEK